MLTSFWTILSRDLKLAFRRRSDVFTALFFFIIVISLFPLGVGSDKATLRFIAPGVIWIAALLASMLALEHLFAEDYIDGGLEQIILLPQPLTLFVFGKILAHWLLTGLPLVLISPLVGLQYHLTIGEQGVMMMSLLIGTPILSILGSIGAALTLGLRSGGVLTALLILPLYIPILIYGAGVVVAQINQQGNTEPYFLMLSAFLILALVLAPWATAAALKISNE